VTPLFVERYSEPLRSTAARIVPSADAATELQACTPAAGNAAQVAAEAFRGILKPPASIENANTNANTFFRLIISVLSIDN
jgi:hypothetical protein